MNQKNLITYKKAFDNAMRCVELTKGFSKSEQFLLSSQMIRSSRSVVSNLTKGYRKRKYPKHLKSKLTDADSENSETDLWLDFAMVYDYTKESLRTQIEEVGRPINYMMNNPEKFQ